MNYVLLLPRCFERMRLRGIRQVPPTKCNKLFMCYVVVDTTHEQLQIICLYENFIHVEIT